LAITEQIKKAFEALGIPAENQADECLALLTGEFDPQNSKLKDSLGLTSEKISEWQQSGMLYDNLQERLIEATWMPENLLQGDRNG
jgi:hypothetical protein